MAKANETIHPSLRLRIVAVLTGAGQKAFAEHVAYLREILAAEGISSPDRQQ